MADTKPEKKHKYTYPPNTKLKAVREGRKLSQEALADRMTAEARNSGAGATTFRGFAVSQWELGVTRLTLEEARLASYVLRTERVSDVLMEEVKAAEAAVEPTEGGEA